MKKLITLLLAVALTSMVSANNITVTNILLTGQNTASDYTMVQFDLSWENSWRISSAATNWDAAWVFVKYRVTDENGGDGLWHHASLNDAGHTAPSGSTIDIGLLTPATAFDATTNPGLGAFIYRSANGTGTNSFTSAQLRWNYGVNYSTGSTPIGDNDIIDIQVFAIEMVYVPAGSFYVGDGIISSTNIALKNGQFTNTGSTAAYQITSESVPATLGGGGDMMNNNATGMADADDFNDATQKSLPTAFPKGYNAFYCMKYEISQQGYVDFLNSLTQTQATARKETAASTYRYGITGAAIGSYATTNPYVACNYLTWADVAAYLDWSGLRPMTELEFEKACRGTLAAVVNECAWGTVGFAGSAYTLSNSGANNEVIATNYYPSGGANYVSATGATGSGTLITVGSTVELVYGMPVSVTAGTGSFAAGTFVTYIASSTTFYVLVPPLIALSGGAVVTGLAVCGNVAFSGTTPSAGAIHGPVREGIFAGTGGNTGRITAGATYYGIMEMSGNVNERPVTVGNATGRLFTSIHGNGAIDANGDADATTWPGIDANGVGFRGGFWLFGYSRLHVSDRNSATTIQAANGVGTGGRGVRIAPTLVIGQSWGGGIIFYIDGTGQHGLIASANDQTGDWGCYGTLITGADGSAIGTGSQNTIDILAECSEAGIAAKLCDDLDEGGYQDWYLPSYSELNELYINRASVGSFAQAYYWCSTEYTLWYAWTKQFYSSGTFRNDDKIHDYNYVRAIRSF